MASITIKTPTRTIPLTAKSKTQLKFYSELENNRFAQSIEKSYEDQIAIIAVFFQRVVARTPLDERYERVVQTKDGEKVIQHIPDEEICREHWYIEESHGKTKMYSRTL